MKRVLFPLFVAALIGIGALGDRILNSGPGAGTVAAGTPSQTSPIAVSNPAVSTSAIDAATERGYAIASQSVVFVDSVGTGTGSGIIYDAKGDIVTNNHVVQGASALKVTLSDGRTFSARLLGTDAADDLAVIHIQASNLKPATFAGVGGYQVAQTVLAIGSPLGLKQSVTSGLISGLGRVEQEPSGAYLPNAIQTSAPINPGNSGGALVTLNGVVVGMPTLEQTSSQDGASAQAIGFAIPSTRITNVANQIIASGKVQHTGRAYLGIAPSDATGGSSNPFGGSFGVGPFGQGGGNGNQTSVSGALVEQLSSSGPAAKAGVQQGDVITAVNGTRVSDAQDLLTILANQQPGNTITLSLNRNGSTMTVRVTLGELPA